MIGAARKRPFICAGIGFAGCALGLAFDARTMLASYLVAWTAVGAISIGALAVLFTSYLVRAGWTEDLYPPLTAAALALPAVALLFLPELIGLAKLYPWAADAGALPAFKAAYLAPWFFVLRTVLYFVIWTALAVWGALAYGDEAAMKRAASAGLIVWALTVSWAGVDWLESIEPHFHSSIYGLLIIGFDLLAGLAFAVVALLASGRRRSMDTSAYSGVLFAVLLLWAYLHAMQYIIIWTGNISEEVVWYLKRMDGGWFAALWTLLALQFFVPFFALLSGTVRASAPALLAIAAATLALRFLEAAILILPPLKVDDAWLLLGLPAAILAVGGSWLLTYRFALGWLATRTLRGAAALQQH